MKKHYILVSVELPDDDSHHSDSITLNFVSKTQKIDDKDGGIRRLHENTWLIDRDISATHLSRIVSAADLAGLDYDVFYLSSD